MIEIVVVLVIIGLLAAVSIPKLLNLLSQSYEASNEGSMAGFGSAVNVVHSGWIAQGASTLGTVMTEEGGSVYVTNMAGSFGAGESPGWPCDGEGGTSCNSPIVSDAACKRIWDSILANPPLSGAGAGSCGVALHCYEAKGLGSICTFTQVKGGRTIQYNSATGEVTSS